MYDDKPKTKLPAFQEKSRDDFQLCALRVKMELREKDLISVLSADNIDRKVTEKSLSLILVALCDKPVQSIYSCETVRAA